LTATENSPIHFAAGANSTEVLQIYIQTRSAAQSIDLVGSLGHTPLLRAASRGSAEAVSVLLDAGANPHIEDRWGFNALSLAARTDLAEAVSRLLKLGMDPSHRGLGGTTPVHLAAANGSVNALRSLLDAGAEVHEQDDFGNTALHQAARYDWVKCAELLLGMGAEPMLTNLKGEVPIDLASSNDMRQLFSRK
jgi:ankyrin